MARPGRGSRKPANVKLRPVVAEEDRARARRKGTGRNAKDDGSSDDDEEEDEADRLAREQFAVDIEEHDEEDLSKGDDKKPLEGMAICSSGTLALPKETISAMCAALGAIFEQVLTTETTLLLADTTGSDKYKACVENGIPVLQSSFIIELHRRWLEVLPFDVVALSNAHRLSPLQGLTICLTGYGNDRNHHRNTIAACGGAAYSPELSHEVTHLVVGPDYQSRDELLGNGKYICAKQINGKRAKRQESRRPIWIVWGEWLEHSLCAFGRVQEEPYCADIAPIREEVKPPHGQASPDIVTRRNSASPRKMRKHKARDDAAQIKSKRKLIKQETLPSVDEVDGASKKRRTEDDDAPNQVKRAKRDADNGMYPKLEAEDQINDLDPNGPDLLEPAAVKKPSGSLAAEPITGAARERSASLAPRQSMKRQQSSAHLELLGVQQLLTVKQDDFTQTNTFVTTSTTTSTQRRTEDEVMQRELQPAIGGSLLAKMGKERSNKFFSNKHKEVVSASPEASTSEAVLPVASTSMNRSQDLASMPHEGNEEEESRPPSMIFAGMTFYIIPGEFQDHILPRVCEAITERGGVIVEQDSSDVDVLLCKTISSTPATFDLSDSRVLTSDWLEACMAEDEIPRDIPLFDALKHPLRCRLPLPGVMESKISVSYSGFDAMHEKPKLTRALDMLGIPHQPVVCRREKDGKHRTTHIIIPDQTYRSERLGIAQAWGIQVVLPQWLREQALPYALPSLTRKEKAAPSSEDSKTVEMDLMHCDEPSSDGLGAEDKPLSECRIHVCRKLKDWRDLENQASKLGARLVQVLDSDMAKTTTHLIFQSNQVKPASRDFSLAVQNKIKVVHPDWLRHTIEKGTRQSEASYKHTRNAKRGLEVVIESQSMSRVSSSSSSKSLRENFASEESDLPPPLQRSERASMPILQTESQTAPKSIRSPQPPTSPSRRIKGSASSATVPSTPDRSQGFASLGDRSVSEILVTQGGLDDSGFVPSAGKSKGEGKHLLATSSDPGIRADVHDVAATLPSARDIMAEMQALMQADVTPQQAQVQVRLPAQQQAGYQSRTSLRKSVGRSGGTPIIGSVAHSPNASSADWTGIMRRQAYNHFVETQFGQTRGDDTQTQAVQDEQTMIIRINDPIAEATKAKLLAGVRGARSVDESSNKLQDTQATQRSTEESAAGSSRGTRSGAGRKRRI